jgi:hypothetical protein
MSTRGCIARLQSRSPLEFKGVYHHWDSYPSGLGQALFQIRKADFAGDTDTMLRTLIDQHPGGWSTIVGSTFRKTPGFRERGNSNETTADDDAPRCYCHGDRSSAGWVVTQRNAAGSGVEYAYALDGARMLVVGSFCPDGTKMIGMFGTGDETAEWRVVAEVDLDGPEPDWEQLDNAMPITDDGPSEARSCAQPVSVHEDRLRGKTQPAR